jgi:hypothetical protein
VSAPAGQRCAWPDCQVTGKRRFCTGHWGRLPRRIRQNLTAVPAGDTPDEVLAWIRRAVAEADAAAERQRQAEADQETLW